MSDKASNFNVPVYDYLLNMIMKKEFAAGEKIPENMVAEKFGISRTPVRDALRQLANDGIVNIVPNRFVKVTEYTPVEIREIGTLRILLDSLSVKLCLLHGSRLEFISLRQIAQTCEDAYKSNDHALRCKLDMDFHMELANISKNSLLIKFQKEINLRVQFIILHYPNEVNYEQVYVSQHIELAEALMEQDESRALKIVREHLLVFYNLSAIYPDGFFDFISRPSV